MSSTGRFVMGRRAVQQLLEDSPERIEQVWLIEHKSGASEDPLYLELQSLGVPCNFVNTKNLNELVASESHQSVVVAVSDRREVNFKDWLAAQSEKESSLVVLLDSVMDPHNVGAVLRASECFAVDAVLWSKNRGPNVTPVVTKSSAGASEFIDIFRVANLAQAIRALKEVGFWVVGAEAQGEGVESLWDFKFPQKTALVLGSEGSGMRQLTKREIDHAVHIPMFGRISSLNISQAAAVFASEYRRANFATAP